MANRTKRACQVCGKPFYGGQDCNYCPDCAYKAQQETVRRHRHNGTKRPLGSIDKCVICGAEYIVVSGRQMYCPLCQRKGVLEWQKGHKRGYDKASGQNVKKMERRKQVQKICVYCLRPFTSHSVANTCSDYCHKEQTKLTQCIADINRGYKRDLDKYIKKRDEYRRTKSDME